MTVAVSAQAVSTAEALPQVVDSDLEVLPVEVCVQVADSLKN